MPGFECRDGGRLTAASVTFRGLGQCARVRVLRLVGSSGLGAHPFSHCRAAYGQCGHAATQALQPHEEPIRPEDHVCVPLGSTLAKVGQNASGLPSPAKPPSWNMVRDNAVRFVARWSGETRERAEAQTFWNELLAIFEVDRKRVGLFEATARRASTGGRGAIDLLWPGVLAAEHKSAGKSLADAEAQALDYLHSLPDTAMPSAVVTSDFQHFRLLDLQDGHASPVTFGLSDLPREIDRLGFIVGYRRRQLSTEEEEEANIKAAKLMGRLYEELSRTGYTGHEASVLLSRVLFLLFGDDTGLWEKSLFQELLETRTTPGGTDVGPLLAHLFQVLDTEVGERASTLDELLARFPYVNGGLFQERITIPAFDDRMRKELLACCGFDWSAISPALFGGMFQAVKDKAARRKLGEHYTTEKNILRVLKPLFLDRLWERFELARNDVRQLTRLRRDIGALRLLDPACGCGNFLVVAYRELRALELAIMQRRRELTGEEQLSFDPTLGLVISPDHFFGIEIEEWPAKIAEVAMFLVDHQANLVLGRDFGHMPERLPITLTAEIRVGNAIEEDWPSLVSPGDDVVVLGNPPFVGMNRMTPEQQRDRSLAFSKVDSKGLRTGRMDYVASWYAKAVEYLRGTRGHAAFVSTNSLTQGEQARTMVPLLQRHGFSVDFGHRTFKWTSEAPNAAVVHVVVVGFSQAPGQKRVLYEYETLDGEPTRREVKRLNFYLIEGEDIAPGKRYSPIVPGLPLASKGSQPTDGGHLIVEPDAYEEVMADPLAAKYLRRFMQAEDMLYDQHRWCLWLVDANPADLRRSRVLRKRLESVTQVRLKSATDSVKKQASTPALFTQIRQPNRPYVALPEVSSSNREYIPGRLLGPDVIAGNKLIVWRDCPLWLFGVLQSAAFVTWVKTFAGRLKSDVSIAPSLAYFTFPAVPPGSRKRSVIEKAAQGVLAIRANYAANTLADLYEPAAMPLDLRKAHNLLDQEVDALLGIPRGATEAERAKRLLASYVRLAEPLDTRRRKSG